MYWLESTAFVLIDALGVILKLAIVYTNNTDARSPCAFALLIRSSEERLTLFKIFFLKINTRGFQK